MFNLHRCFDDETALKLPDRRHSETGNAEFFSGVRPVPHLDNPGTDTVFQIPSRNHFF